MIIIAAVLSYAELNKASCNGVEESCYLVFRLFGVHKTSTALRIPPPLGFMILPSAIMFKYRYSLIWLMEGLGRQEQDDNSESKHT